MSHLAGLLQHQLSTESNAFHQLPTVLATLTVEHLHPSPHTVKWITRINSLMHSRDPAAKWCGFCLALKTCELSQQLMLENAETWMASALAGLSRTETVPLYHISVRLGYFILSSASHLSEYQRQVAQPSAPKFANAMVALAEKYPEPELQTTILNTLDALVYTYPTILRPAQPSMYKFALRNVSGAFPCPAHPEIVPTASTLLATLHMTAGKVAGTAAWKKTIDGAINTARECLGRINSAVKVLEPTKPLFDLPQFPEDPIIAMPLALDRLRCMISVIIAHLQTPVTRPVTIPVGALCHLVSMMLQPHSDLDNDTSRDAVLHNLEMSFDPIIVHLGARLLTCVSESVGFHITSHVSPFLTSIADRLSASDTSTSIRTILLETVPTIISSCPAFHSPLQAGRLTKAAISSLTLLLPDATSLQTTHGGTSSAKGKGKKRARGYEGDELLKPGSQAPILDTQRSLEAEAAVAALLPLLRSGFIPDSVCSLAHRILLALLLHLPHRTPQSLSVDLSLHARLLEKVQLLCAELASMGRSGWMSRTVGAVVTSASSSDAARLLEQALHPRLPPMLRAPPAVNGITLYQREETKEEKELREAHHLATGEDFSTNIAPSATPREQDAMVVSHPEPPPPLPQDPVQPLPSYTPRTTDLYSSGSTLATAPPPSMSQLDGPILAPMPPSAPVSTPDIPPEPETTSYVQPDWALPAGQDVEMRQVVEAPISAPAADDDDDDDMDIPPIDTRSDSEEDEP